MLFYFSFEDQLNLGHVSLDFEGKLGFVIGVGYEIIDDLSVDFTMSQQTYDINLVAGFDDSRKRTLGEYEINFSRLALNYTF